MDIFRFFFFHIFLYTYFFYLPSWVAVASRPETTAMTGWRRRRRTGEVRTISTRFPGYYAVRIRTTDKNIIIIFYVTPSRPEPITALATPPRPRQRRRRRLPPTTHFVCFFSLFARFSTFYFSPQFIPCVFPISLSVFYRAFAQPPARVAYTNTARPRRCCPPSRSRHTNAERACVHVAYTAPAPSPTSFSRFIHGLNSTHYIVLLLQTTLLKSLYRNKDHG